MNLRLPTVRWPALLLLASVGFTALGVIEASRAIRSQRAVAEHALRDYAGFAAWSYQQHLRETLAFATHELLGAVNHGDDMHTSPRIPAARELAHYLPFDARCDCHRALQGPNPAIFFGFRLGTDTLGVGVNTHADPSEGWEVDRPMPVEMSAALAGRPVRARVTGYTAAERAWINDTLTRQIRGRRGYANFPLVVATQPGAARDTAPRVFVYTLMPTTWGDTLVYGAEYARASFAALLSAVMHDRGLVPATFTRGFTAREILRLRVSDARGAPLFESESGAWTTEDMMRLPPALGSLGVRAQIRPELADRLIIGGLPRSRLPFLLGLLAVSAALAIVALGQIRREGELARMRGDFVDSVSHELRTPLAQMRLYLETLRLGRFTSDEQRRWSLDNVERETTRLSHLVERVLRFSRVGRTPRTDAAPADDGRAAVDVAADVRRIVDEFRPLAAARRAELTLSVGDVPALRLESDALRHVLLNLLDNAVKYGPTGQVVRVSLRATGGEVRLEVADEGPGVPAADRDAIWQPYRRGRTAGATSGSGIGLAIVRDVAERHGGRAWVEAPNDGGRAWVEAPNDGELAVDGTGARFVVALPAGEPLAQAAELTPRTTPRLVPAQSR